MKNSKYYDLYHLRELTESIFHIRQQLDSLERTSDEYMEFVDLYDELWRERNELENKIVNMCDNSGNRC